MNKCVERLYNGIIKENPTFVLMLGMCPTLAVTTSAMNGLGMGLTTAVVLTMSNLIISLLRKVIPSRVRIPAFIVIIASFVTAVQLLLQAYLPSLNDALGVYIPLIVVNCIILGRAESYAYSNPPIPSLFDGLGMGLYRCRERDSGGRICLRIPDHAGFLCDDQHLRTGSRCVLCAGCIDCSAELCEEQEKTGRQGL